MATRFRIRFGEPHAGWLQVRIEYDDSVVQAVASYIPFDTLADFVAVGFNALDGRDARVVMNEEPDGVIVEFLGSRSPTVVRVLAERQSLAGKREELRLEHEIGAVDFATAVWRGLRALVGAVGEDGVLREWHREFPTADVQRLGTRLREETNRPSRLVADILTELPDSPDLEVRPFAITDRAGVQKQIARKLRRRRK
jgi:hypothetical protein